MQWWNAVYTKTGFTINNGQSIISRSVSNPTTPRSWLILIRVVS